LALVRIVASVPRSDTATARAPDPATPPTALVRLIPLADLRFADGLDLAGDFLLDERRALDPCASPPRPADWRRSVDCGAARVVSACDVFGSEIRRRLPQRALATSDNVIDDEPTVATTSVGAGCGVDWLCRR
jgi:hypothetical protein